MYWNILVWMRIAGRCVILNPKRCFEDRLEASFEARLKDTLDTTIDIEFEVRHHLINLHLERLKG